MQHLNNFNSAVMFLQDCEDYINLAPRIDFQSDQKKTCWSSALLTDAKKQTWRNARDDLLRESGEPTWEDYKEWCLNQVCNPAVKIHDVGRALAKATMRNDQSVQSFNNYLAMLWSQRDCYVTDAEQMESLRDKIVEKIPLEAMKEAIQPTTYATLLQQYQGIEQRLRRTNELLALDKTCPSGDKTSTRESSDQHAKPKGQHGKNQKDQNKGLSTSASQGQKPARTKLEDGDSTTKQKKPLAEIQCWECQQMGHFKGLLECPKYVASNETRNQGLGKGKGKA